MAVNKNTDISADMKKVKTMLKEIPKERQAVANTLFNELVFMQNTLNKLKKQVEEDGAISLFKQGSQEFLREHPALKAYNTTIQRFNLIYKQLMDLLPPIDYKKETDPLLDFIKGD